MLARIKRNEKVVLWLCLAFSFCLLVFFGLGWRLDHTLRQYLITFALTIIIIVAWKSLGFHKDRHFLRGSISRSIVVILISYALVTYALGIFLGFNRGYLSNNLQKLFVGLVPTLLMTVVIELARYVVAGPNLHKRAYVVFFTTLTTLLYILIELNVARLGGAEQIFIFLCATVMPIIAREALCGLLSYKIGLLPTLIFKIPLIIYPYILPIVPDLGDYIHAVANIILPFVIYLVVQRSLQLKKKKKKRLRHLNFGILSAPILILAIILTVLVSGIFHYQLIAVGSDSMLPVYGRGDTVLFEKVNASDIHKDDILVFNKDGVIITHRVVSIDKRNNVMYFTTRGDNNDEADAFETPDSQVLGRVVMVGKYIGFPTLWINEIFNWN